MHLWFHLLVTPDSLQLENKWTAREELAQQQTKEVGVAKGECTLINKLRPH